MAVRVAVIGIVGSLGACLSTTHRYLDVQGTVDDVRRRVEDEALVRGMEIEHERDATLISYALPTRSAEFSSCPPVRPKCGMFAARFHALDRDRTRVELSGDSEEVAMLLQDAPGSIVKTKEEDGWSEWLGVGGELSIGAGVGHDPEHGAAGRVDLAVRASKRLWRFGEVDDAIRPRWALAAGAGLGVRFGPEAEAFRPELTISFERISAGWFAPRWRLPSGHRTLIDLSVAGLVERQSRRGIELGVAIRRPPWIGFYARAGVMGSSDTARGGPIFSIGIDGGSLPSIGVLIGGILIGSLLAAVRESITDGFKDVLGGE